MAGALAYVETLAAETHRTEAEVVARAIEIGLQQMWRERTLARFVRGEISRDEAISAVGLDWVGLAERQHAAVLEDLAWALGR